MHHRSLLSIIYQSLPRIHHLSVLSINLPSIKLFSCTTYHQAIISINPSTHHLSIHPCLLSNVYLHYHLWIHLYLPSIDLPFLWTHPPIIYLRIQLSRLSTYPFTHRPPIISHQSIYKPTINLSIYLCVQPANPSSISTIYPPSISTTNIPSINRSASTLYHRPTYLSALSPINLPLLSINPATHQLSIHTSIHPFNHLSIMSLYPSVRLYYLPISTINLCNLSPIH